MLLLNDTSLQSLYLIHRTPEERNLSVIVLRMDLDLVPLEEPEGPFTHALRLSEEQRPLDFQDHHYGNAGESSLKRESDTAPVKPRCDVVLIGEGHSPGGRPSRAFPVRLRLVEPGEGRCILDKRLRVTGERWLHWRPRATRLLGLGARLLTLGRLSPCPWRLTRPEPIQRLPLIYEYAFGGFVQVMASNPIADRIPAEARLPGKEGAVEHWRSTGADSVLAQGGWDENYCGRGYLPEWFRRAAPHAPLPAPQVEDPDHPFSAKAAWKAASAQPGQCPELRPQGLGPVTRNWLPRLRYAGTWDEAWKESGATYPKDYSYQFNNYAPTDLQCPHLEGDEVLELTNLCPASHPGVHRDPEGNQVLRFQLPGLHPCLHFQNEEREGWTLPAVLDTLILEPDAGRVTLLHRVGFPEEDEPDVLVIRLLEQDEPETDEAPEAVSHGD